MKLRTAIIIGLILIGGVAAGQFYKFNLPASPEKTVNQPRQEKYEANITTIKA